MVRLSIILGAGVLTFMTLPASGRHSDISSPQNAKFLARKMEYGRTPRRPLPGDLVAEYYVDSPISFTSRQGTAFVLDPTGNWVTAAHVTNHCARLRLLVDQKIAPEPLSAVQAGSSDIALMSGGSAVPTALRIAGSAPKIGLNGYHMGFPMGAPGIIGSKLLGTTRAVYRDGHIEPMLAWVEDWRTIAPAQELDGLSGAPTLDQNGKVVGVVSMEAARRGRILTALPSSLKRLLRASKPRANSGNNGPITSRKYAVFQFQHLLRSGLIRQVYCDL